MAIIYETKDDLERDKLKEQALETRLRSEKQLSLGLASGFLGAIIDNFNLQNKNSNGLRWVSGILSVFGLVEAVRSIFTHNKAHDLDLKRERMGVQTVVFPPDVPETIVHHDSNDKSCCSRSSKYSDSIKPVSLLDRAEKADSPPLRQ